MQRQQIGRAHRPGRRTPFRDLDRLVAAGESPDPLAGNYILACPADIALAYPAPDGSLLGQLFPATTSPVPEGGTAITVAAGATAALNSVAGTPCCVTGDFSGAGQDSVAVLTPAAFGLTLALFAANAGGTALIPGATATVSSEAVGAAVRAAAGRFDAQATAATQRLALAYVADNALAVQVWDAGGTPRLIAGCTAALPTGDFALVAADVNGDGLDELALFWQGAPDKAANTLFLTLFSLGSPSGSPSLAPIASAGIAPVAAPGALALAAGSCSAPGIEQVILAWIDSASAVAVLACTYSASDRSIAGGTPFQPTDYPPQTAGLLCVAAGDLNDDGLDEIVVGTQGTHTASGTASANLLILRLLTLAGTPPTFTLQSTALVGAGPGQALLQGALDLRVGAVAGLPAESLVVACVGSDNLATTLQGEVMLTVGVIPAAGDAFPSSLTTGVGSLPGAASLDVAAPANGTPAASLLLGALTGGTIRVGPPQMFTAQNTTGIVAIINAPPGEAALTPTFLRGGTVNFNQTNGTSTSLQIQYTRDWATSDTIGGNASFLGATINHSLTKTYGTSMSDGTTALASFTTGIAASTDPLRPDDYVLVTTTDYQFWEYPVYNDTTGNSAGQLLVVWPVPDTCKEPTQTSLGALSSYYNPQHVPGRLMSYPPLGTYPPDYESANELYAETIVLAGVTEGATINWQKLGTQQSMASQRVALAVNTAGSATEHFNFLAGLTLGVNIAVAGMYSTNTVSTQMVSFQQSTNINVLYNAVADLSFQYSVNVFLYTSNQGNHFVLDYQVGIGELTFWQESFAQAMPTFGFPWANASGGLGALSRDIDPACASGSGIAGTLCACDTVTVAATVRNFGLAESDALLLTFYQGDPAGTASVQIGQPQPLTVPARGAGQVAVTWTPPNPQQAYPLYCRLQGAEAGLRPLIPRDAYNMYPPCYWSTNE